MRIPDDIEDLVLALLEPEEKKELRRMSTEEIFQILSPCKRSGR